MLLVSSLHWWFLCDFFHGMQQGADIKWFGDVIGDVWVDIVEFLSLYTFCGEHDDGVFIGEPVDCHFLYGFDSVHDRHHEIQDNDSLESLFQFNETVSSVVCSGDLKAFSLEQLLKAQDDIRVVVDNHYFFLIVTFLVHTSISFVFSYIKLRCTNDSYDKI